MERVDKEGVPLGKYLKAAAGLHVGCREEHYVAAIKSALGCHYGSRLDLGFAAVVPDLNCGGVPVEVECAERVHLGLGQALAYKYAAGAARLVVITDEATQELRKFLKWAADATGVEILLYVKGAVVTL